jgi:uncharacterized protein (DUF697 family)
LVDGWRVDSAAFVDVAVLTFVQLDMLEQLARLYGVEYSEGIGRSFITALANDLGEVGGVGD